MFSTGYQQIVHMDINPVGVQIGFIFNKMCFKYFFFHFKQICVFGERFIPAQLLSLRIIEYSETETAEMNRTLSLLLLLSYIFLQSACKLRPDKIGLPNYNAELLGPIVNGKYSGTDFIRDNSQFSSVDSNGLVTLMYRGEIPPLGIEDVIRFQSQQFLISGIPGGTNGNVTFSIPFSLVIPNGPQLTEAELKAGKFKVSMSNVGSQSYIYSIRFRNATRNGEQVVLSALVPPMGLRNDSFNLSNTIIDMTRGLPDTYNSLEFELTLTSQGSPINFQSAIAGSVISISDFQPRGVRGYLCTYVDTLRGNFQVPIFDRFFEGQLLFEDPYIQAHFSNSFGIGGAFLNSTDLYISGRNPNLTGVDSVITGTVLRGFEIGGSGSPGAPPNVSSLQIRGTGDNFPQFLSIFPSRIQYQLPVRINTATVQHNQFIYDTCKLGGTFEFGLPLSFRTQNLAIKDTLPFKMQGDSALAKIVDGKLITFVKNGLPVEFYFQAYFLDEFYNVRDSLFESQQLVQPAIISGVDGRISVPSTQQFVTDLSIAQTDKVKQMRNIKPEFRVKSIPQGQFVKIYNDFTLEFKVVGDLRFNLLSDSE